MRLSEVSQGERKSSDEEVVFKLFDVYKNHPEDLLKHKSKDFRVKENLIKLLNMGEFLFLYGLKLT